MQSGNLKESLLAIAAEIFTKSQAGQVSWQTVGGEPSNYHVHFGDGTSFIVCYRSSEDADTKAMISLKVGSVIAARIEAREGEENFDKFKQLFDEAHRAATGWDKAIKMIQDRLSSGESVGDAAGDIPL